MKSLKAEDSEERKQDGFKSPKEPHRRESRWSSGNERKEASIPFSGANSPSKEKRKKPHPCEVRLMFICATLVRWLLRELRARKLREQRCLGGSPC